MLHRKGVPYNVVSLGLNLPAYIEHSLNESARRQCTYLFYKARAFSCLRWILEVRHGWGINE